MASKAKVFVFELFSAKKAYGDLNSFVKLLMVKNASDKADARQIAEKNAQGLRLVNAGSGYASEEKAMKSVEWTLDACGRNRSDLVIVDAASQRNIAKLLCI